MIAIMASFMRKTDPIFEEVETRRVSCPKRDGTDEVPCERSANLPRMIPS